MRVNWVINLRLNYLSIRSANGFVDIKLVMELKSCRLEDHTFTTCDVKPIFLTQFHSDHSTIYRFTSFGSYLGWLHFYLSKKLALECSSWLSHFWLPSFDYLLSFIISWDLFTSEFPYFALLNSFLTFPLLGIKPPSALPWLYPFPWTPFLHLIVNGSKSERHISIAFTLKSITSTLDQRMV